MTVSVLLEGTLKDGERDGLFRIADRKVQAD